MSKHFKMYITITDIIDENRIDFAYLITGKEVVAVSIFSDNIQYEFTEPHNAELGLRNKRITTGTRELIDLLDGKIEITQSDEKKTSNNQNE